MDEEIASATSAQLIHDQHFSDENVWISAAMISSALLRFGWGTDPLGEIETAKLALDMVLDRYYLRLIQTMSEEPEMVMKDDHHG